MWPFCQPAYSRENAKIRPWPFPFSSQAILILLFPTTRAAGCVPFPERHYFQPAEKVGSVFPH